jgi:hypothetical protein
MTLTDSLNGVAARHCDEWPYHTPIPLAACRMNESTFVKFLRFELADLRREFGLSSLDTLVLVWLVLLADHRS